MDFYDYDWDEPATNCSSSDNIADMQQQYQVQQHSHEPTTQQMLDMEFAEKMRQTIEPYKVSANDKVPPLTPILKRHDTLICSEGNISAVVGEAKSKKTFLCTAMVGAMLDVQRHEYFGIQHNRCKVLWVDTEQSAAHVQKVMFRINIMGGLPYYTPDPKFQMLQLREASPKDRFTALEYGIALYQPKLVVVDGISDLMTNTNNLEESEELVSSLLRLSSVGQCHIMCVLHANPNSDKARGHLGSTLMRKAETILFVHKTGEVSMVEPQYCRNSPFESFAFRIEEAPDAEHLGEACVGLGIPVECERVQANEAKENICVTILRDYFGGSAEKPLLYNKLQEVASYSPGGAKATLHRAIKNGLIVECNKVVSIAS